jgi:putative NIF3 family GTP cyclohydrolase 1 type 2
MEVKALIEILNELVPGVELRPVPSGWATLDLFVIGVAVDPTPENLRAAAAHQVDLLLTYHPWTGEAEAQLKGGKLRVLAIHGAWDYAPEGLVQDLVATTGLTEVVRHDEVTVGNSDLTLRGLIEASQRALGSPIVPYYGELRSPAQRVGIFPGAGFLPHRRSLWEACLQYGCDTLLSGELTMAALRFAAIHRLNLVDLGHSAAAKAGMEKFRRRLEERVAGSGVTVAWFDDLYAGNYLTNYSIADGYSAGLTELDGDDTLSLFAFLDKTE